MNVTSTQQTQKLRVHLGGANSRRGGGKIITGRIFCFQVDGPTCITRVCVCVFVWGGGGMYNQGFFNRTAELCKFLVHVK